MRKSIEKAGYKISSVINGGYVAKKDNRTIMGTTITEVYNKIIRLG